MTKTAKVDAPSADIYEKADDTSKKLASLAKGTAVRVIGKASAACSRSSTTTVPRLRT